MVDSIGSKLDWNRHLVDIHRFDIVDVDIVFFFCFLLFDVFSRAILCLLGDPAGRRVEGKKINQT